MSTSTPSPAVTPSISRRAFAAGAAALVAGITCAQANAPTPVDLQKGRLFTGVIDIYDENDAIPIDEAWRLGVRAIMHETGMGLFKRDHAYAARKSKALAKNMLWGAFHLVSAESTDDQLDRFLSIEGGDDKTAMAIDWEPTSHGQMPYEALRSLIGKFHDRKKFYPILYCDSRVNKIHSIAKGDELLSKCPLWFAHPTRNPDRLGIPEATWKRYALWQFDDEKRLYGAPYPKKVLPGADWNAFVGTEADLRTAWPLRAEV